MIKLRARLKLYKGDAKRKTAFISGYRPLFDVLSDTLTSGMITLLDRTEMQPGDEAVVEIKLLEGNCSEGEKFHFFESSEPLGEVVVLDILDKQ